MKAGSEGGRVNDVEVVARGGENFAPHGTMPCRPSLLVALLVALLVDAAVFVDAGLRVSARQLSARTLPRDSELSFMD